MLSIRYTVLLVAVLQAPGVLAATNRDYDENLTVDAAAMTIATAELCNNSAVALRLRKAAYQILDPDEGIPQFERKVDINREAQGWGLNSDDPERVAKSRASIKESCRMSLKDDSIKRQVDSLREIRRRVLGY